MSPRALKTARARQAESTSSLPSQPAIHGLASSGLPIYKGSVSSSCRTPKPSRGRDRSPLLDPVSLLHQFPVLIPIQAIRDLGRFLTSSSSLYIWIEGWFLHPETGPDPGSIIRVMVLPWFRNPYIENWIQSFLSRRRRSNRASIQLETDVSLVTKQSDFSSKLPRRFV